MKPILFFVIILFYFCTNSINAQSIISQGIKGGLNISNIRTEKNLNTSYLTGFSGGCFLTFENVKNVDTQIELYFIYQGFNYESKGTNCRINIQQSLFHHVLLIRFIKTHVHFGNT